MAEIMIGSVVTLASGGPAMTVVRIAKGRATCAWATSFDTISTKSFPLEALEPAVQARGSFLEIPFDIAFPDEIRPSLN